MKFFDLVNILNEQPEGEVPASPVAPQAPTSVPTAPPAAALPPEPKKVLTSGYEKARQITIDCLTILKNATDMGVNMEGIVTPELEEAIKPMEVSDAVSNDKIAATILQIHDGVAQNVKNESPAET